MSAINAFNDWKQRNPRAFIASLCACIVVPLLMLSGRGGPGLGARYPPGSGRLRDQAIQPLSIETATRRSEELWARNVEKRRDFIHEKGGVDKLRMFSEKGVGGHWGQLYTVWDIYVPAFPCFWEVERIGRIVDGGKYTCGLPRIAETRGQDCVVYSFGVAEESSWEAELLQRTDCQIYMYDFSVTKYGPQIEGLSPAVRARAHFFPYGIGSKDETIDGHPFYTLRTLMRMNGHDWIDILKVDVEGAEFWVLPDMIKQFGKNRLPFEQLLLEIHVDQTKPKEYDTQQFVHWWDQLEAAGLRAFAAELNYPALHFTPYPQAMEMNFINYGNRWNSRTRLLRD